MVFLTLCFPRAIGDSERAGVETLVHARGGRIVWRTNARVQRSYGLVELHEASAAQAVQAAIDATVYHGAIIALAVFPAVAEALPHLLQALGGDGRPAGVASCVPCQNAVAIEWDPQVTESRVLFGLIDAELRRFASGRTVEILSPLTAELSARVAAGALGAPEIAPDRILEVLLERVGLPGDA